MTRTAVSLLCLIGTVTLSTAALAQEAAPAEAAPAEAAPAAAAAPAPAAPAADTDADADADEGPKRGENTIYAEGLGAGLLYSINYERLVIQDLGVRVGFSYVGVSASAVDSMGNVTEASSSLMTFPITASYLGVGGKTSMLELGGGVTLVYASASGSGVGFSASASGIAPIGNLLVGYRLHPIGGGFNFRVGAAALIAPGVGFSDADPDAFGAIPWFYLSLGGSF